MLIIFRGILYQRLESNQNVVIDLEQQFLNKEQLTVNQDYQDLLY